MGTVIIMRAVPGSGKSTYAKKLLNKLKQEGATVEIFSSDKHFYELGNGVYKFDFTQIPIAHGKCFKAFIEALQSGIDYLIVDNTNLSTWEISPYKLAADAYEYKFLIKNVEANPEEALARNVHGVPAAGHKRMTDVFNNEQLLPWWDKENVKSKTVDGMPLFEEEDNATLKHASLYMLTDNFSKIANSLIAPNSEYDLVGTYNAALPMKDNYKGTITQVTDHGSKKYPVVKSEVPDNVLMDGEDKKCTFTLGYIGSKPVAIITRFLE
jgi:predicted kinase